MMILMMIAAMIVRVSNLSRKGHDNDNDKDEGDDHDVKVPVQERPALPHLEEEGASDDVDDDKQDGE